MTQLLLERVLCNQIIALGLNITSPCLLSFSVSDSAAGPESPTEGAVNNGNSALTSPPLSTPPAQHSYSQYSVQALTLLAEVSTYLI